MKDRPRRISRRSANAVLAGVLAWPMGAGGAQLLPNAGTACAQLISIFKNFGGVSEIGLACIKSIGHEIVSPTQLAEAIMRDVQYDEKTLKMPNVLRERICDRVRVDFAENAVVNIDGWILSVTEVRLYSLLTLLAADDVYNMGN